MVSGFWSMVCRCKGMVLGSRGMVFCGSGVVSLSLIGDISYKAVVAIGVVADMLDTSIRQVDRVGSFHIARSVTALISAEHSLGVVIGYCVVVGVGRDFVSICWLRMVDRFCWCMVCRDSFNNRSVICRSCLYNRGMVSGCHFNHRGMVDRCRSMVGRFRGMICRCRGMVGRCRGMVGRSSFDNRGMVGWSRLMVCRGGWGMVDRGGGVVYRSRCMVACRGFVREGCRCKVCYGGLLATVAVAMHALGRSMRLADHAGVHCPVRLVSTFVNLCQL